MSYKELVSLFCPIKNPEIAMFALAKWVQGRSPCKKKRCHSEAATAVRLAAEESRAAPIYKRGAVPVRRGLMCIIVKLKSNVVVRTFERQNKTKSLCNFDTTQ